MASIAALSLAAASSASAQTLHRTWVSGHGTDAAGCGAPATPCRSLQYAHDHVAAAGGEIDVLDPAGYGALTITKAISIVNDGVGTAGVQQPNAGQDAITVSAGAGDAIYLRGLNIDGVNGSGRHGVNFISGARLIVDHCVVRHFLSDGVLVQPTVGTTDFGLYDSSLSDDNIGSVVAPGGGAHLTGVVDRVIADGNVQGGLSIQATASASAKVVISNSDASNNGIGAVSGSYGVSANASGGATVGVGIDNSTLTNNLHFGYLGQGAAKAHIARSILDGNGQFGIDNAVTGSGATFSAGNNHGEENGAGALNGVALQTDILQ